MDLTDAPQWRALDREAHGRTGQGLVTVLVAESGRSTKAKVAGFLLDVWCLGVKNAIPPDAMSPARLAEFRATFFSTATGHVQVPAEVARALVFGAADYARALGIDPEADFDAAATVLGEPTDPCPIRFGKDGKPYYVNGPRDDVPTILQQLRDAVGDDGFHCTIVGGAGPARLLTRSEVEERHRSAEN